MADNLLDKASILLTPTAYNDGRMLSVKPNENLYGTEEVTNGDFATDSNWSKGTGWTISGGKANGNNTTGDLYQENVVESGKKYKVTYTISNYVSGSIRVEFPNNAYSGTLRSANGTYTETILSGGTLVLFDARTSFTGSIDNVSVVEDLSGDFTFSRSSAATRVNAQGLVENVQILSPELVSNGNFSQIGTEEVSNGNFSQEGSELITNGDFSTDSNWTISGSSISISGGKLNFVNATSNSEFAQQSIVAPIGKTYKITLDVSNLGSGESIKIRYPFQDFTINTNGTHILYGVGNTANVFRLTPNSSTASFSIDNVSVKEVGQDWTLGSGWSIGDDKAVANTTGNFVNLYQNSVFVVGKTYKTTFTIVDYTQGKVRLTEGGVNVSGYQNAVGTYTTYFTASQTALYMQGSESFIGSITNISVKEVGQDWTLNNGAAIAEDKATIIGDGSIFGYVEQLSTFVSGKKYKVTLDAIINSGGGLVVKYGLAFADNIGSITTSGSYTFYYTAGVNGSIIIGRSVGGVAYNSSITNISVKEITDDTDLPRINYEGFSYQDSLGSELVVNGGFDTDSNWNKTQATISNGEANISSDGSYTAIDQSNVSVIGKTYFYSINVKSITGTMQFRLGSGTDVDITTIGIKTGYIVATSTTLEIKRKSGAGAINATIDNVSVKEVLGQEVVPDSGCGSWLLEPQSTNIIPYSEDFSASSWIKSGSSVESGYLSPSEEANASKFTALNTDPYLLYSVSGVTNLTYSASVYIKGTTSTIGKTARLWIIRDNVVFHNEDFTITDSWQRISTTKTFTTTPTSFVSLRVDLPDTNVSIGDETYIWGAQLEQQSYATSYIPTNGATNTRLQDIANNSGNSTLINSTEGVLYAEISALGNPVSQETAISISQGQTGANRLLVRIKTNGAIGTVLRVANNTEASIDSNALDQLIAHKVAVKYKVNDIALWIDGIEIGTDNSANVFSANTLNEMSFNQGNNSNFFYGKTKALAVYKEALTDANLRSLTYPNAVATTFDLDFDTIAEQFTFTRGSEATFVNAQGLIESTASNDAPRIDYSTGAKAFLLENQSTNLIPYSSDFSQSSWTKYRSSILSNNAISPDGTLNADKLVDNSNNATHALEERRYSLSSGSQYTYSFFAKASEVKQVGLLASNPSQGSIFDLENGIVYGDFVSAPNSSKIENFGNGWYRCSITTTLTSNDSKFGIYLAKNGSTNYTGNGTDGLYIFGAMLENQSFSTSYIPTSGASATRNQELCNNATPVINSEEGTLYAEFQGLSSSVGNKVISLNDGTNTNAFWLYIISSSNGIRIYDGATIGTYFLVNAFENNKFALVYNSTNTRLFINGSLAITIPFKSISNLNKISFSDGNEGQKFEGNIKGLKYYPKALADVQLEDLTS